MSNGKKFCKYVSFESKHWKDIFLNSELYTNTFDKFNDMYEGLYSFCVNDTKKQEKKLFVIIKGKMQRRICCFSDISQSENEKNLMWAHYANSHNGFCIEFEILDEEKPIEVCYCDKEIFVEDLDGLDNDDCKIVELLTRKNKSWEYEKEHRIITKKEFIKIKITKVTLGKQLLDVEYRYKKDEHNVPDNILKYAKLIRCLSGRDDLEIDFYENRFENNLAKVGGML